MVMGMKGQVYIIVTILILIFLILIKIETDLPVYQTEVPLSDYYFNIRQEATDTVDLALLNEQDIGTSLDGFISLISSSLDKQGIENSMDYVIEVNGNNVKITFDLYLSSGQSFLSDSIVVERETL